MLALQAAFEPEYLKGNDDDHAAYHEGLPILVKEFRECASEFSSFLGFLHQWLNEKIFSLSLSEFLALPAIFKDGLHVYQRERSEYVKDNASNRTNKVQ